MTLIFIFLPFEPEQEEFTSVIGANARQAAHEEHEAINLLREKHEMLSPEGRIALVEEIFFITGDDLIFATTRNIPINIKIFQVNRLAFMKFLTDVSGIL
ncbi:MAG: hypothetical protein GYA41_04010 [Bacteroidales bacterium]|nr:hypothetical protein [Bacteroidales bacterium]